MKDERRWSGGATMTLAVSIGWLALMLGLTLYFFQFPQDGWRYGTDRLPFGAFIAEVNMTGQPSVLQAGDRVAAIDGQPVVPDATPPIPSDLVEGQTFVYTVSRSGQMLDLSISIRPLGRRSIFYNMLGDFRADARDQLVSLAAFLVVGFAFFARPGNLGARYLFIIFAFYAAVGWLGFFVSDLYLHTFSLAAQFAYGMIGLSWVWFFFASLILMPLAFPVIKAPLRRFPRLLPALVYGLGFAGSVLAVRAQLLAHDGSLPPLAQLFFMSYLALTIVSIFGTLVHNWITLREPVARAQLRWMTLGMGVGLGLPFSMMLVILFQRGDMAGASANLLWLLLLLPICLTIAITRYRLFDIDVIIRRTLVYSVVTALLALVFFGTVILLQRLFTSLTGQASPIAIVASTLVIAALFSPLRRRVQDFVDRRFYRRKYDAQRVLSDFAVAARNETDVDRLTGRLGHAVESALHPAAVGIWVAGEDSQ